MWSAVLTDHGDLLKPEYPYLQFDHLATFRSPVGIDDDAWKPTDEFDNEGGDESEARSLEGDRE